MGDPWRWTMAVVSLAACLVASGCTRPFVPQRPVPLAVAEPRDPNRAYLQWLGTSTWIMSRGDDVVVLDPFFSRPTLPHMLLSLLHLGPPFVMDPARIEDVLPDLPANTRFVLAGHAHYDHLMDVPYYVARPSGQDATYVGSATARALLNSFTPAPAHFEIPSPDPEQPIRSRAGAVVVRGFVADHAPHLFGINFMQGELDAPLPAPPTRAGQWVDGTTYVYLIDFLDAAGAVAFRVFATGAANRPEAARALAEAAPIVGRDSTDVAVLCVPGWDHVEGYPESMLQHLRHRDASGQWHKGPRHVVLSHFDDFWAPYRNGEDPNGEIDMLILANYRGFRDKLRALVSEGGYRFELHEPRTGECLAFPAGGPRLACQRGG